MAALFSDQYQWLWTIVLGLALFFPADDRAGHEAPQICRFGQQRPDGHSIGGDGVEVFLFFGELEKRGRISAGDAGNN